MADFSPEISRVRTSRSLRYPLHYSDLEACFAGRLRGAARLHVLFTPWRLLRDTPTAERPGDGQHPLLKVASDPQTVPAGYRILHGPTPAGTRVLKVWVYAVPAAALSAAGLERKRLRDIVERQLARLGDAHLSEARWWLALRLCGNEREVESRSQKWTGLRPEDEQRMRVPLDAVDPP